MDVAVFAGLLQKESRGLYSFVCVTKEITQGSEDHPSLTACVTGESAIQLKIVINDGFRIAWIWFDKNWIDLELVSRARFKFKYKVLIQQHRYC